MLLQTNSYIVPQDKRAEHARLMRRFRHALHQVGCDNFEVYEQVGANWGGNTTSGRFVQIMRFRDRRHQQAVQAAERNDPAAQQLIAEFCELINYPQQQQQQQFVVGFYASALPVAPALHRTEEETPAADDSMAEVTVSDSEAAASAYGSDELHAVELDETPAEEEVAATTDEAPSEEPETVLVETPAPESSEDVLESAGELAGEDIFADDSEALAEAETEEMPTEEPAAEVVPEPQHSEHSDEEELDSELMEEGDDISRLAEELAAEDDDLGHSRHPDSTLHGRGRASGNGAH